MISKVALVVVVLCGSLLSASGAEAALVASNGGQTVYDTVRHVTWLANGNLAATQKFGVADINADGSMSYTAAQQWVAAMNAAHYLGTSQWRLPATQLPDRTCSQNPKSAAFGLGCTNSEMGDLYYNGLGGVKGSTINLTHNASYSRFNNFQPYLYWSATL